VRLLLPARKAAGLIWYQAFFVSIVMVMCAVCASLKTLRPCTIVFKYCVLSVTCCVL
jgi:hypothetical protein